MILVPTALAELMKTSRLLISTCVVRGTLSPYFVPVGYAAKARTEGADLGCLALGAGGRVTSAEGRQAATGQASPDDDHVTDPPVQPPPVVGEVGNPAVGLPSRSYPLPQWEK